MAAAISIAFIEGVGGPELLMILLVTLLFFGSQRLPELARNLGKSIRDFKKAASGVEEEIKRAIESAPPPPPRRVSTAEAGVARSANPTEPAAGNSSEIASD